MIDEGRDRWSCGESHAMPGDTLSSTFMADVLVLGVGVGVGMDVGAGARAGVPNAISAMLIFTTSLLRLPVRMLPIQHLFSEPT